MADVSVIVPSYNHAAFVAEAIEGVLRQTAPVREVVVVDDGSTDGSLERLRALRDERIRLVVHECNRGGAEALNTGIRETAGDLIAICNSDDVWEPDKIERQLRALDRDGEAAAVFSDVTWIDGDGAPGDPGRAFRSVFDQPDRSRAGWLRRFVEEGNCLCHPSVLIRRGAYQRVGLYDNRYRQLPDYELWLRLVQHFEIAVMPDRLVRFRLHDNTSRPSPATSSRTLNESADILEALFLRLPCEDFFAAFGTLRSPHDPAFDLACEKVLYLFTAAGRQADLLCWVGGRVGMSLLATAAGRDAWSRYGFSMSDFHTLRGTANLWQLRGGELTAAERDVLVRAGASSLPGEPRPADRPAEVAALPAKRAGLPWRLKVRREVRRLGRQIGGLVGRS
ncbi:glycosyltransferase [Prosthecomicrobium pneumaticum]|uniref:Glycosyltransferase involved in cell wall biosynthesis n=1 Tax=Prosthecomicrobium pneumaticum TaxID=81895 RepID=A0A7W9FQE1_9HYPH|nr:glycosyltransferase involved in cell wall biosynthesis [Prosthecomicrobium pneumaticum]